MWENVLFWIVMLKYLGVKGYAVSKFILKQFRLMNEYIRTYR